MFKPSRLLLLLLLAGCSRVPMLPNLTPYKIDVQQGNYITQDMVEKLKPGMTRNQVRFILGTPLIADPFHAQRWDYMYQFHKRGELKESRHITVVFDQDRLTHIEGDVVAAGEKTEGGVVVQKPQAPADRPPAESAAAPKPQ